MSFMGHALMENDNGLLMDFLVSRVTGRAERDAVPVMLEDVRQRGYRPRTLGGRDFVYWGSDGPQGGGRRGTGTSLTRVRQDVLQI